MYAGDDEPCNIVRKGDVMVSLSNTTELVEHQTRTKSEEKFDLYSSACG